MSAFPGVSTLLESGLAPPLVAALAAIVVAVAGARATVTDAWYHALRVPGWKPPDWAFGPVWTVIFVLTASSGVIAWNADAGPASRALVVGAFTFNAVLNIGWSVLFFRLRRPDWALVEVALLWLSIVVLIGVVARVAPAASLLNLPYLAWVGAASVLNLQIVRMNPSERMA